MSGCSSPSGRWSSADVLRLLAPAKLNLTLEVLGKRADGFHELRSVVQTISLYDELTVRPAARLAVRCTPAVCAPGSNLALRAARALRAVLNVRGGATIELRKRIPVGAGLGGGSSDAAAVLRLLAHLWGARLPNNTLTQLAAALGSDVPLFLAGAAALVAGRGERVQPLPPLRSGWLVLVVPPWSAVDKTARVYRAVTPAEYTDGERTATAAFALRQGAPLDPATLVNGLRAAAGRVFPDLDELQASLEQRTGVPFQLAGAGPTLFYLAPDLAAARACAQQARALDAAIFLARPLGRRPALRSGAGRAPIALRTSPSRNRRQPAAPSR